ncbi:fasciclin domain-containing protein [Roseivirga misakiensis]|uniref:FAS1 domain-containing protein n=1 Tax=Roseivirga misakiensis TaxID=1563681 RepID=A0A1E5T4D9_9BACT|nr:fasciclin domain-containing protein [Roseivirga misakiensis]OEK06249.1 hypothetical protein BFP71_00815 [Roseivirga misakiensis]
MKLDNQFRLLGLCIAVLVSVLFQGCDNSEETAPEDSTQDNVGTLIMQSQAFSEFASLINIADSEIPVGELGVLEMLNQSSNNEQITVFAPSDAVFEALAIEWSSPNFQASIADVINEFTHSGQPAKTRDFLLGHIFRATESYSSSRFQPDLSFESEKGIRWRMIASEVSNSGFGFVLENSSANANPYFIYETDVLTGNNGVVHAALVN